MKFMKSLEPLGLLAVRSVLGLIFLSHGYPKLVHPTEPMRMFFVSHGLPGYFLEIAGIVECFGAACLIVGLFTRPVALLLTMEMAVAIWKVHSVRGILAVSEYEFPLVLSAACFVVATIGAALISVDHLVLGEDGKKRRSPKSIKE